MLTYSVAIRTLGLSVDTLRRTLCGVFAQSVSPEKVIVYIAEGFSIPDFRIGTERYVYVPKGMVSQRALPYDEIESDAILMLDDDILLGPGTAERMLTEMESGGWDLLGADVFKNHQLPLSAKIKAAVGSLVFPHFSKEKAFRLNPSGSFSYPYSPQNIVYKTDTIPGNVMLWRKEAVELTNLESERWMDSFGFAFGDDALISYKAVLRGMRVGVDFGAVVTNLDARSTSDRYRRDPERYYTRTLLMALAWDRMCLRPNGSGSHISCKALLSGIGKALWLMPVMLGVSIASLSARPVAGYFRGLRDAIDIARTSNLPPYAGSGISDKE